MVPRMNAANKKGALGSLLPEPFAPFRRRDKVSEMLSIDLLFHHLRPWAGRASQAGRNVLVNANDDIELLR